MTVEEVFRFLKQVPLFNVVADADLRRAAEDASVIGFSKHSRIFEEKSDADSCYVVAAGRVKVVLSGRAGSEMILGTVGPHGVVGELALIDGLPRSAALVAMEECRLVCLRDGTFATLRKNAAFESNLVVHVTSMLRRATGQLRAYTYTSRQRICFCLVQLAAEQPRHDDAGRRVLVISPRPSHQELADRSGCSRETVTRVLMALKARHRISWDSTSFTLDENTFRRYVEAFGDSSSPNDPTTLV